MLDLEAEDKVLENVQNVPENECLEGMQGWQEKQDMQCSYGMLGCIQEGRQGSFLR